MTLPETIIAILVTLLVVGSTFRMAQSADRLVAASDRTVDLHQRARTAFIRLHRDLIQARLAVEGTEIKPRPAVWPGGVETPLASQGSITIVRTLELSAAAVTDGFSTAGPIPVRPGPACQRERPACGLGANQTVLLVDDRGRSGFARVTGVRDDSLWLASLTTRPLPTFSPGTSVWPLDVRVYSFDPERSQVRLGRGGPTDAPFLDHVTGLSFEYYGSRHRPSAGGCGSERFRRLRAGAVEPQVKLSPSVLTDGPWCGDHQPFDTDLLRVRRVRVVVRLRASGIDRPDAMRLFGPPAATVRFDVTLRDARW